MLNEIKNIQGTARDWLHFGVALGLLIVIISGIKFWKSNEEFWLSMAFAGAVVVAAALLLPRIFSFFWRMWMILAILIGWVMTRVLLVASFFLALTPVALLLRLTGKRVLTLNSDAGVASYWEKRPATDINNNRGRYEQQF